MKGIYVKPLKNITKMKDIANFNSMIWQIAMLVAIVVTVSGCFSGDTQSGNSSQLNIRSENTTNTQSEIPKETITDCFKGFKFGMSQYEITKHTEKFQVGVDGYEGKCDFNGYKDCFEFKMNDNYIYVLPTENLCEFYEGKAFMFSFFIDVKDFYSFIDFYRNSKEKYVFSPTDNDEEFESYNFDKANLRIRLYRYKKSNRSIVQYINLTVLIKIIEDKKKTQSK